MNRTELVCERRCGYEVAVSNAVESAFLRNVPDECARCGADLEAP